MNRIVAAIIPIASGMRIAYRALPPIATAVTSAIQRVVRVTVSGRLDRQTAQDWVMTTVPMAQIIPDARGLRTRIVAWACTRPIVKILRVRAAFLRMTEMGCS